MFLFKQNEFYHILIVNKATFYSFVKVWDILFKNEWFSHALEKFAWTVCNLVSYPDGDCDGDRNISVMNSVW
jgi:hypothetical protein